MTTKPSKPRSSNELLSYRMDEVEKSLKSIEGKIDAFINGFAPMREVDRLDRRDNALSEEIESLRKEYRDHAMANSDYPLVRKLVYGTAGVILTIVVGAIAALVITSR